jgi:hypothetical protein
MENKLNKFAIEDYSRRLAEKLVKEHFTDDTFFITGSEITKFSPIEQVNLFIIKNVFFQWKEDMEKIKSTPFFDYESAEVQEKIQIFANSVSNHIKISKDLFESMLGTAIEETFNLALSPYHYFKQYYFIPSKTKVLMSDLKEMTRYLRINKVFFENFIQKVETYRIPSFLVTDILDYFQEAYYDSYNHFDSYDGIIDQFNLLLEIDLNSIVYDLKRKDITAPTPLEVYETQQKTSSTIELTNDIKEQESAMLVSEIETNNLNNNSIVHSTFELPNEVNTIEENINTQTVSFFKISLSLNERIMFTRSLFDGSAEKLNQTLAQIEKCSSRKQAMAYIDTFGWDYDHEVVQEFLDILDSKLKTLS